MAYCPSPLLFRSTVTPLMRCMTLATVMSGLSSMAFALITFITCIALFSNCRAPVSVTPGFVAITTASESITSLPSMHISTLASPCAAISSDR